MDLRLASLCTLDLDEHQEGMAYSKALSQSDSSATVPSHDGLFDAYSPSTQRYVNFG